MDTINHKMEDKPGGKRKRKTDRPAVEIGSDEDAPQTSEQQACIPSMEKHIASADETETVNYVTDTQTFLIAALTAVADAAASATVEQSSMLTDEGETAISQQPAAGPSTSSGTVLSAKRPPVRKARCHGSLPPKRKAGLVLDEATGLFKEPDNGSVEDQDVLDTNANEDKDAAEDDDFYERGYPEVEDSSDEEGETTTGITEVASTGTKWQLLKDGDSEIFSPPDFESQLGPTFTLPHHAPEIDYFYKFISPALIRLAQVETNSYASYHQKHIAKKINQQWKDADYHEMQAFIGILVCMGIDRKSAVEDYWSSDVFLQNQGISSVMTRSRFQMLMRYFHLASAENDPRREPNEAKRKERCEADPFYKVNPWMVPVLDKCVNNYLMGRETSISEGMVRFKGYSRPKQKLSQGSNRQWFKIWQLCDSATTYVANFAPYLGVKYKDLGEGKKRERGVVKNLMMELVEPFSGYNHTLFCDSLFTNLTNARELMEIGIYIVGIFNRRNYSSLPPQLIPEGKKKKLPLKVGEMRAMIRTDCRINITAYQDRHAQVLILNTLYPPLAMEVLSDGYHVKKVPLSLHCYRKYMGGVDRSNQQRKYYHTGQKNNRWWTYLAFYLLDIALSNAYVCYKHINPDSKVTHKMFNLRIGKQLIAGYSSRSQPTVREVESTRSHSLFILPENLPQHVATKLPGRQKCCKICSKDGMLTAKGRLPETSKGCSLCRIHLHEGECFAAFHHRMMLRGKKNVSVQFPELPEDDKKVMGSDGPVDHSNVNSV